MAKIYTACALILISVLLFNPNAAQAQVNTCKANGCGPGGILGKWVADRYPGLFTQCEFRAACDKHDICYSNCMKCSSWYGTDKCKKKRCWFKWDNKYKKKCDQNLYRDITLANSGKRVCKSFARAYKGAVTALGCGFYYGQTFNLVQAQQFQRNFDALMKYYEYHSKNNIPLDQKSIDAFTDQFSHSPAVELNFFEFSIEGGSPLLSVKPLSAPPPSELNFAPDKLKKDMRIRRFINGIDVTEMRDDSASFSAKNLPKGREAFDFKVILEPKQGQVPGAGGIREFDYKSFQDFRDLKGIGKFQLQK